MFDKLVELVIAKKHLPITYFLLLSFISNDLSLFISNGRFIFSFHSFPAITSLILNVLMYIVKYLLVKNHLYVLYIQVQFE